MTFYPQINHSGDIAVLWNNDVNHVLVLTKEPRAIHMLVHDSENSKNSIIFGIYASAQPQCKDVF